LILVVEKDFLGIVGLEWFRKFRGVVFSQLHTSFIQNHFALAIKNPLILQQLRFVGQPAAIFFRAKIRPC
jgi:hypothetical protein